MKNTFKYYFAILLPMPLLVGAAYTDSTFFVILLASYYVYRSFTDGQRLIDKGVITKKEFPKVFIPFWTARYFSELYFN